MCIGDILGVIFMVIVSIFVTEAWKESDKIRAKKHKRFNRIYKYILNEEKKGRGKK